MNNEHDDTEFIDEEDAELTPASVKRLREKLQKTVEEKQEYLEGWQRSRADFANYKREEAGIHADRESRIKGDVVEELLPALDTFEMALRHDATNKELQVVYKQLIEGLRKVGVEQFGNVGDTFDPHRYEALQEIPTDDVDNDHTVESVHRAGYSIDEKIIRPAQVAVYTKK